MNLTYHDCACLNLDFRAGVNNPVESAADGYGIALYRAFHRRVLAEDKGPRGDEHPLYGGVEAEGSGNFELAVETNTLFKKTGPFTGILGLAIEPR